jgi:Ca2+/Na+ antiporter
MRKGTKKTFKKFKKNNTKRMWGDDAELYNTVGSTVFCCNFQLLQLTRLLSTLVLLFCVFIFFYIYVKAAIFHYIFVALFVTFLAFGFVFIGSGKQVVYQKLVNKGDINYSDEKKRSNLWRIGVLLYGIAIPLVITSNFIYFVPLSSFSSMFDKKFLAAHPYMDITNQSM